MEMFHTINPPIKMPPPPINVPPLVSLWPKRMNVFGHISVKKGLNVLDPVPCAFIRECMVNVYISRIRNSVLTVVFRNLSSITRGCVFYGWVVSGRKGSHSQTFDLRHEKTDLKVFVVVIRCHTTRAHPSFGMTPTFREYDLCSKSKDSNSKKSVSYQKKDGRGHARPSFFMAAPILLLVWQRQRP